MFLEGLKRFRVQEWTILGQVFGTFTFLMMNFGMFGGRFQGGSLNSLSVWVPHNTSKPSGSDPDPGSVAGGWWLVAGGGWDRFYIKTSPCSTLCLALSIKKTMLFEIMLWILSIKQMFVQYLLGPCL